MRDDTHDTKAGGVVARPAAPVLCERIDSLCDRDETVVVDIYAPDVTGFARVVYRRTEEGAGEHGEGVTTSDEDVGLDAVVAAHLAEKLVLVSRALYAAEQFIDANVCDYDTTARIERMKQCWELWKAAREKLPRDLPL